MRGLIPGSAVPLRVRVGDHLDDVICVTVENGAPLGWLRSADVLVLPSGSRETAEHLFARFPGCSVVVASGRTPPGRPVRNTALFRGTPNLIHVRGGAAPPAAVPGDPRAVGALAHARRSRAHACVEEAGPAGHDRAVVVSAGAPRAG